MSRLVIGVAPGITHTGVVLRTGDTLRAHHRVDPGEAPFDWYLADVVDAVTKTKNTARNIALQDTPNMYGSAVAGIAIPDPLQASDGLSFEAMIDLALIVGAVAGHWPTTRIPAIPDRQALTFYPPLLQARPDRILREAWDLAGAAIQLAEATP